MSFPISPTNGQQEIVNGILYTYASASQSWTRVQGVAGNITATGNITASSYIISGTGIFYSNGNAYSSGSSTSGGYFNSTLTSFPGSAGNYDYGSGETYVGESAAVDAFGVYTIPYFSLMDPAGSTPTTDLGALT